MIRKRVKIAAAATIAGACLLAALVLRPSAPNDGAAAVDNAPSRAGADERRPVRSRASIRGVVIAGGRPASGAAVALGRDQRAGVDIAAVLPLEPIAASDDGSWLFTDVAPGRYAVIASAPGFMGASVEVDVPDDGDVSGVVIELGTAGHVVSGVVEDVGGGPVVGAVVAARPQSWRADAELATRAIPALTDSAGRFALRIPDGFYELDARASGYVAERQAVHVAGTGLAVDFSLFPASEIRGVVLRRDGSPVAGARVTSVRTQRALDSDDVTADATGPGDLAAAMTAGDGSFALTQLKLGDHMVQATGPGYATTHAVVVSLGVGDSVDGVQLTVEVASSIRGVVRRAGTDEPVAGAAVAATHDETGVELAASRTTNADGAFEIHGAAAGRYTLWADKTGFSPRGATAHVEVAAGAGDVDGVVLELDGGARVRGRVSPPGPARVLLRAQIDALDIDDLRTAFAVEHTLHATADDDGVFEIAGVPSGQWNVVATTPGGRGGQRAVRIGTTDVDVVVELDGASVSGRVLDASGQPVAGVTVRANHTGPVSPAEVAVRRMRRLARSDGVPTDAEGRFVIAPLEPGEYSLAAIDPVAFRWWIGTDKSPRVTLRDGEHRKGITLRVEPNDLTIEGSVTSASGPVADALVVARFVGRRKQNGAVYPVGGAAPEPVVMTDATGRFVVTGLRRGVYDLFVESPALDASARADAVDAGDDVALRMDARGSLRGSVPLAGGEPCHVIVVGRVRRTLQTRGAQCPFRLSRLEPGSYRLMVWTDAGVGDVRVAVPSGGEAEAEVALAPWASVRGAVVDAATGKPIPGRVVIALNLDGVDADRFASRVAVRGMPRTDGRGAFTAEELTPGDVVVAVAGANLEEEPAWRQTFEVAPGQTLDLGTIEVEQPRAR